MYRSTKLMLTAFGAMLALAAIVGTASARRLEFSNQRFRAVWQTQPMIFEAGTEIGRAICPVTLEGSFHSKTISKVSGQLIGYITRAAINACGTAGSAREIRLLTETLPWHMVYVSFTGTLPKISSIDVDVVGWAFVINLEFFGICLYKATVANPASFTFELNENTGEITLLRANSEAKIRKTGGPGCPAEAELASAGSVTVLGSETTKITVRLVQ